VFQGNSQLTFWHETPTMNEAAFTEELGPYYMTFHEKALYPGPYDDQRIPLLDYHGDIGRQYNPIAVAQYALGNYNLAKQTPKVGRLDLFLHAAEWLAARLVQTPKGTYLWEHLFDLEYFRPLKAPWFSGLAQGQGLSVLVRAFAETGEQRYLDMSRQVYRTLTLPIEEGGVQYTDPLGYNWIEEYLVDPPTHILNGFMWALWGIHDYYLLERADHVRELFMHYVKTIMHYLPSYDTGFWSLYELTPQRIRCIASTFYHRLHIVQLEIMHRLTGERLFSEFAAKWASYAGNPAYRLTAKACKAGFKLLYY